MNSFGARGCGFYVQSRLMSNTVTYLFRLESGDEHRFDVELDRPAAQGAAGLPAWTALAANTCPHCPLPKTPGAVCPAAADLAPVVKRFSALASIVRAEVRVITAVREVRKDTDVQTALSGLMGLILATGGCPILHRLRPLAQTHLPFLTETEMVYRMAAMQLFGCFLRGEPASFDGLHHFFDDLDTLDKAFAERLRLAAEKDASLNALMVLHARAMIASLSIDQELERIRRWFAPG
jgi:hypothetical protein